MTHPLQRTIESFLAFLDEPARDTQADERELMLRLDQIAVHTNNLPDESDESDHPDPPSQDYASFRKQVEAKFPRLGDYYDVWHGSRLDKPADVVVGDSFDDIVDIAHDLRDVLWCFENTTETNAIWHARFQYTTHFGMHLRALQHYLHSYLFSQL